MNRLFALSLSAFLYLSPALLHADEAPPADPDQARLQQELAAIKPHRGVIPLPGGLAQLDVPEGFYYIDPKDADTVLTEWGNPPGTKTLGMLFPSEVTPFDGEAWGVVITYDDSGHVSDDDAKDINYDDLMNDMKKASTDANEERRQAGYPPLELVGWAESPSYDAAAHKMYWAKDLRSADHDTLNYFVRVLGREGVLELNAVASMEQLEPVRVGMGRVIAFADFVPGQQYKDYREGTDRLAAYGLAGLVAGGVAVKTGLWAKLLIMLLAAKKAIIAGFAVLAAWIGRVFFGKKDGSS